MMNLKNFSSFINDDAVRYQMRLHFFRILAVTTAILGINYIAWRYTASLNYNALWIAIPLVLAETYTVIDTILFIFMMWKPPRRTPPPAPKSATVDIFITTYNEPIELVYLTAEAATRIAWENKKIYILDDGSRPALEAAAKTLECGYITRGAEWAGKQRHAKAGNVNNALLQTDGEFVLILDADQIPTPTILERTVGYFNNPKLAFVQTPQYFYNLPPGDPFGSDAPLFYGPIQQGKDGWNAAFFCGSNAVLRREALLQLGLTNYVREMEEQAKNSLDQIHRDVKNFQASTIVQQAALENLKELLTEARKDMQAGRSLEYVSEKIRNAVAKAEQEIATQDFEQITNLLKDMASSGDSSAGEAGQFISANMAELAQQTSSSVGEAMGLSKKTLEGLNPSLDDEAIPIHALATISITEDMATAMRLHAMGWQSIFHPEILAYGLAPEDLGSALSQRLRWAQGTVQVFLRENPFFIKGLSFPQRLQYFTTMYSYFNGFFSLIFLVAPIIYLFTGVAPVSAWSSDFFWKLIPYLIMNKLLFMFVASGMSVFRGEQYNLALFPLWIQAVMSVFLGIKPKFVVTPKQRQTGNYLRLVWPQLLVIGLTALAIFFGLYSWFVGKEINTGGVFINTFWSTYNIFMLFSIVKAALYKPPADWKPSPPEFLFPTPKS
jgi:cellulose synthase (UDP-forming)